MKQPTFLPMSRTEMEAIGWDELDILLITGDCYVDHPSFGVAIIGRVLVDCGFRVGIVAQPDWKTPDSLRVMGIPKVGIGVTSGNMDSMVNIYTAGRRLRKSDMFSEGGRTGLRPPHALVVYSQLAKQAFPGVPVMSGGLEASLRRITHYDYWQDKLRPSIILDTKNDIIVYGMGERPTPEVFHRFANKENLENIPGTVRLLGKNGALKFDTSGAVELPPHDQILKDPDGLMTATKLLEANLNAHSAQRIIQWYGERLLVIEPPPAPLSPAELDHVHELPYARLPHPKYKERIPAFDAIIDSVQAVRGCPGGCAFCGLVAHQGRSVMSRTPESICREIKSLTECKNFKGTISDVGGAAGNIYGSSYDIEYCKHCHRVSCLYPVPCQHYHCDGQKLAELLRTIRKNPKVKHLFINSGIRLDLALRQPEFLHDLIKYHVSGHLKVAPEHLHPAVTSLMRKSKAEEFYKFMEVFEKLSREYGKEQFLIPLFISNFPGCTSKEMKMVDDFLNRHNWSLQQVQDYIPLPMTMGGAMYYTGKAPDGTPIAVNRGLAERRPQIHVLKKKRHRHK